MKRFASYFRTKILIFCLLFVNISFLFSSETDISYIYAQLDGAFSQKSSQQVSDILKKNSDSEHYKLFESYALKKTRQLIIENELELARQTALAVIDNNIENFDAVDLYSYIDRAILNEQASKIAEANRLKLEQERIALLNARAKDKIEKSNTYQTVSTSSGDSIYFNENEQSFSAVNWNVQLGIVDLMFQTVTKPESYQSVKYGLSFGADVYSVTEQYVLGMDIFGDFQMLTMGSGEEEFMFSGRIVPEIAFASVCRNLFLRLGFSVYGLASDKRELTGSVETFASPVFGVGFDNINIGASTINLHFDYCIGHFAYEDLTSAMEFGGNISFPLTVNDKTKISLNLGVSDLLFIKDDGIDNRCKGIFAIGVGNVNK